MNSVREVRDDPRHTRVHGLEPAQERPPRPWRHRSGQPAVAVGVVLPTHARTAGHPGLVPGGLGDRLVPAPARTGTRRPSGPTCCAPTCSAGSADAGCGNETKGVTYYHCKVKPDRHAALLWYPDHPPVVTLRVDVVPGPIADFFGRRIFGPNRRLFLAQAPAADPGRSDHEARAATLRAQLVDLQRRQHNLMRELENDTPTGDRDLDTA